MSEIIEPPSKEHANAAKHAENNHLYEFCRFRFDPENHLLERDGGQISLTPKAFEILHVLVQNGSRLTTKEELMRRVWPDSFVEEANLTVNISALRKQLGETPDGQQYIETVPRKGYRFAVPVTQSPVDSFANGYSTLSSAKEVVQEIEVPSNDSLTSDTILPTNATAETRWYRSKTMLLGLVMVITAALIYTAYRHKST